MTKKTGVQRRWIIIFAATCLVVLALIAGSIFYYLHSANNNGKLVRFIIVNGAPVQTIAQQLHQYNVIRFPLLFQLYVRFTGKSNQLQAGEYEFSQGVSPLEVIEKLTSGDVYFRQITIPEGLTSWEVVNRLSTADGLVGKIQDVPAEGKLLPETYYYTYGESRLEVLKRMQDAMDKIIEQWWPQRHDNIPVKTIDDALILASIVEKETGLEEERGRVAAVFVNRLRKMMRLQTDPTVIYAITGGKFILGRPLSRRDLKTPSPYNTYLVFGLPPTPIANPSVESIKATLQPPETDEYYFVADGKGGHHFAKTLEEHNKNVAQLRKLERERKKKKM